MVALVIQNFFYFLFTNHGTWYKVNNTIYSLPLDLGCQFLVGSSILLLMVVQQLVAILVLSQEKMSTPPVLFLKAIFLFSTLSLSSSLCSSQISILFADFLLISQGKQLYLKTLLASLPLRLQIFCYLHLLFLVLQWKKYSSSDLCKCCKSHPFLFMNNFLKRIGCEGQRGVNWKVEELSRSAIFISSFPAHSVSLHGKQMGKQWKQRQTLFSWAPKSLQMVTAAMKLKDACSLEQKL